MQHLSETNKLETLFFRLLERPIAVIAASMLFIIAMGTGLTGVVKDPSVDAFVSADHPAAVTRERAKQTFGLEDPIIIGLSSRDGKTVFTPRALETLRRIEREVRVLPTVQKQRLISVLHDSAITGNDGDLDVQPIVGTGTLIAADAVLAWQRVQSMPMMMGLLASETGDTVTLIVPVKDPNAATETYASIRAIADAAVSELSNVDAHVAGVAAMNGRLAHMVDTDTKRLIPLAILTALLIIFLALRRWKGVVGALLVIAGSAAIAIGCMGWMGSRYYLITTALPVIIMAISIADSLHISIIYMRERELDPSQPIKTALVRALCHVSVPVTLTSITTVAGFTGLALGTSMVPIREFGIYAAVGVVAAWWLSLTLLPAVMFLLKLEPRRTGSVPRLNRIDRWVSQISSLAFANPVRYAGGLAALLVLFGVFAVQAKFDYARKLYFQPGDAVRKSDITLNDRLAGLNFLDVVVTGEEEGSLLTPEALSGLKQLSGEIEALPHITQVTGIDDYIAKMHEVLTGEADALPTKARAGAQYMFLYEASGDPGDFQEEIDYTHSSAMLRAQLRTDRYSEAGETIAAAERVLESWEAETGLQANLSGRIAVNDGWMDALAASHFRGLSIAVILVLIAALLTFRAVTPALLTLVPVLTGVLFTYAVMGAFGIAIAPATSMTAAIATGLGVDFAIHLISEIRKNEKNGVVTSRAFHGRYGVVARACVYSALALAIGLAVICTSTTPPLRWFGGLVATAAIGSLIGAIFVLPALYALLGRISITQNYKEITQ